MKKKTRRSEALYPALDPKLNLKTRQDLLDYDYVDQLPETWTDPKTGKTYNPKQWLNDFTTESVLADFKTNKKRIHKKKKVSHEKNRHLKSMMQNLSTQVKDYIESIKNHQDIITLEAQNQFQNLKSHVKNSIIHPNSKLKIKSLIVKTNEKLKNNIKQYFNLLKESQNLQIKELDKLIESEFKYIEDYYKSEAEGNNNRRNSCVLSRAKAQGAATSIDLMPDRISGSGDTEDYLIAMIDAKNESED